MPMTLTHRKLKSAIKPSIWAVGLILAIGLSGCARSGSGHKHRHGDGLFGGLSLKDAFGHEDSGRPPGWDQGNKTGWKGGDVPPGLQKKNGGGDIHIHLDHDNDHPGKGKGKGKGASGK